MWYKVVTSSPFSLCQHQRAANLKTTSRYSSADERKATNSATVNVIEPLLTPRRKLYEPILLLMCKCKCNECRNLGSKIATPWLIPFPAAARIQGTPRVTFRNWSRGQQRTKHSSSGRKHNVLKRVKLSWRTRFRLGFPAKFRHCLLSKCRWLSFPLQEHFH